MNDSTALAFAALLFLMYAGGNLNSTQLLLLLALMTTGCVCGGRNNLFGNLTSGNQTGSTGGTTGNATTSTTTTTTTRTTGN